MHAVRSSHELDFLGAVLPCTPVEMTDWLDQLPQLAPVAAAEIGPARSEIGMVAFRSAKQHYS
ncbi:hypothetical protein E3G44_001852 [Mycobacteroides abscessus]|uniref:Uncharacterized protein n=1 Tax=Mycobacteroides abscessus 21 TaxID=1299324 RepID=A0A829QA79_9MYCO|nr:hypothetical protein I543_1174 [Mycobacteroides abscessus 21]MBE5494368.1 hypothetical protein [Mycobacteroides abscessus]SHP47713.1 Uncharacterised protein [Mycobacteroides abscessus subsp. abscessus]SHP49576.1 Uncharacterised protein [Mycobacteroides abscessus subsp. abscessus]SHP66589.1 Uncharacterised protein [Mycobacteroides abscessus subsp. abscessus]